MPMAAAQGKLSPEAIDNEVISNSSAKDYLDPPPGPLVDAGELGKWSLYRAVIAEFTATLLFVYVAVATVVGHIQAPDGRPSVQRRRRAGHRVGLRRHDHRPRVLHRRHLRWPHQPRGDVRAAAGAQDLPAPRLPLHGGAVRGRHLRRGTGEGRARRPPLRTLRGRRQRAGSGYTRTAGLIAEIAGTFVLVYTVFSATDPKCIARDPHVPVLAPLLIGFAVLMAHLATIPVTGTGINPARSFGAAVVYNGGKAWDDHWIFWVGPFIGAAVATVYHQYILRNRAIFRSNYDAAV